jgi:hypothetical protein
MQDYLIGYLIGQQFRWGLKIAPATSTRLQEMIFLLLKCSEFLKILIDDLCVFADTVGDLGRYLDHVRKAFDLAWVNCADTCPKGKLGRCFVVQRKVKKGNLCTNQKSANEAGGGLTS